MIVGFSDAVSLASAMFFSQQYTELPGNLILGAPEWIVPTLIVGTICTLLVIWNYSASKRSRWTLLGAILKLAGIALLAVCMLQPMRSGRRPRPRANLLPIVIDDSRSMNVASLAESETWHQRIKQTLKDENQWPTRFSETFDVRTYAFDNRLREFGVAQDLVASGDVSRLSRAVSDLSQRLKDRPVAAAILMSDGNDTQQTSVIDDWSQLGFPIYPVVPTENRSVHDLRIVDTSVRQSNFETAPVTVSVQYDSQGMASRDVVIQVRDRETDTVVAEKRDTLAGDGQVRNATFRFRPEKSGLQFYRVVVFTEADRDAFNQTATHSPENAGEERDDEDVENAETVPSTLDESLDPVQSSEITLVNNSRFIAVDRDSGPYRVLYVAGRANWEFKFLRRAIDEDAEVQLVGLLRIAKEEPKFSFRDRGVSETNPLFQGLDEASAAAEQYDEPVIIRLGVKEGEELSKGFPKTADELFAYHAIILDDIEPEFFSQDQMLLIRQFVSARGGGLLMLGGVESFAGKRFADTPLGALSPFYESRTEQHESDDYQLALTREGMLQPWLRLRETETAEFQRLREMIPFRSVNAVGPLKPGALELASVATVDQQKQPALAAQRFGKGRCAAMPVADLWRWSMHRSDKNSGDPEQLWRQIVRWLVGEVPQRVEASVADNQDVDGSVTVTVYARDESYLGVDNATVALSVLPPDGQPLELRAAQTGDAPGVYTAKYWPRTAGPYLARIAVSAADGTAIGETQAGWTMQRGGREYDRLNINTEYLKTIAQQSGGRVLSESDVDDFIDRLPSERVPVTETWVYPIWHRPWIMIAALLCFCTEWGLRRWRGMV